MTETTNETPVVADLRFRTSDTMGEFAKAMADAQAKFESPKRDKTAKIVTKTKGTYSYTYADLASVLAAIRKPLSEVGIAVIQAPMIGEDEQQVIVTTRLIHSSGEWAESSLCARAASDMPQAIGSAITYMRRYALSAMTGIATEEDDDGVAAERARSPREPSRSQKQEREPDMPQQGSELKAAATKLRTEVLKRSKNNAAAAALLSAITKEGKKSGIRTVDAFETIEQVDKAWARLEEIGEVSMMPTAKPADSAPGPVVVASSPEPEAPEEPEEVPGDSNLFSS